MKLTSRLIVPVMDDDLPMDTGQDAFYFTRARWPTRATTCTPRTTRCIPIASWRSPSPSAVRAPIEVISWGMEFAGE
jgi:hypothetical protein